jgi:hypothetical protein
MRTSGVGSIVSAVVDHLQADAGVTALVPAARIGNEIATGTTRPYIVVEVETETDDDTFSLGGVDAVLSVTPVSDYRGSYEIGQIASAVRESMDGRLLTVAGFVGAPADVTYEQALGEIREDVSGVTVRRRPLWFRVRAL